jgi:hypothetical protein
LNCIYFLTGPLGILFKYNALTLLTRKASLEKLFYKNHHCGFLAKFRIENSRNSAEKADFRQQNSIFQILKISRKILGGTFFVKIIKIIKNTE